jgi:uncharacterized repeat protein (TIGR01451 family)
MKGVAIALVAIMLSAGMALGNPPIKEPVQYEQLCNELKLAGNGTIDMSTSMLDKRIAMDYFNSLLGQGIIEIDLERVYSQKAGKVTRDVALGNGTKPSNLNLFESSKVTYSGLIPLIGDKYLRSKEFYGGIGAAIKDSFSVNELQQDEKTHFGSTDMATGAHLIGVDTKSAFNGSWQTDSSWHKIFYKDIESHQGYSGKFEMERQVKLQEEEPRESGLDVKKTPSRTSIKQGDIITYEYQVKNTGKTTLSGLALSDSDLGMIELTDTTLMPGQTASGKKNYIVTEDDLLKGPRETTATATGLDSFGVSVRAINKSSLVTDAYYYSQGNMTSGGKGKMNWTAYQVPLNLDFGNLTIYAMGVNMTMSRQPAPECPYHGWHKANALSVLQFGITDGQSLAWQELTLALDKYSASQIYTAADENTTYGPASFWNSTYGGTTPNGGFNCTKDPAYDTFDLKLVLTNPGLDQGLIMDSYQRIHKSTEMTEPAGVWRQIGHQEISEAGMNKTAFQPYILVGDMNTEGVSAISWSGVIVTKQR